MALSTLQYSGPAASDATSHEAGEEPLRITFCGGTRQRPRRETPPVDRASGSPPVVPRVMVPAPQAATGMRRPDRRGQAPKGAGGMPRRHQIRAWKAAICPGELPNERRSRNARATQGTETSQYLEEKKSTETPSVAASERGPAQTGRDTVRGRGAGVVE